jgi:hypothetical protein
MPEINRTFYSLSIGPESSTLKWKVHGARTAEVGVGLVSDH